MNGILKNLLAFLFGSKAPVVKNPKKTAGLLESLFSSRSAKQQKEVVKQLQTTGRGGYQPPGSTTAESPNDPSGRRPGDKKGVAFEMVRVVSSNVHSIGYDDSSGTLAVRYLAPELNKTGGRVKVGGKTNSPGPLYHYFDVPPKLWKSFETASSKGKWVWDHLRVRGTIAGHQYDYRLVSGTVGGSGFRQTYIPRRASGKGFISRTRFQAGQKLRSNLATQHFSTKKTGKQYNRGR